MKKTEQKQRTKVRKIRYCVIKDEKTQKGK